MPLVYTPNTLEVYTGFMRNSASQKSTLPMKQQMHILHRTYILALIAVLILGISGGIYWARAHQNDAGASSVATTAPTLDPELAANYSKYLSDSSNSSGSNSGSSSNGAPSKPTPSPILTCDPPHFPDVISLPQSVTSVSTDARDQAADVAQQKTTQVVNTFAVKLPDVMKSAGGILSFLNTSNVGLTDQQIWNYAVQHYLDAPRIQLSTELFSDLNDGTIATNGTAFAVINGKLSKTKDYFGRSAASLATKKDATYRPSDNTVIDLGYAADGKKVSITFRGLAYANIGTIQVGAAAGINLSADYGWPLLCPEKGTRDMFTAFGSSATFGSSAYIKWGDRNIGGTLSFTNPDPIKFKGVATLEAHLSF